MPENEPHKGRRGRRKGKHKNAERTPQRRTGLVVAIASGAGLGAFIGLLTAYLLTLRSRMAANREPEQILSAWQDVARKLSEQLQSKPTS